MENLAPRKKFRKLFSGPRFIIALGIWDPFTARVAESLGIECVHLGGYQLGIHYMTSEPLMTLTEVTNSSRYVTSAVRIPLVVDAGTGFGEPLHVMRTVKEYHEAVEYIHGNPVRRGLVARPEGWKWSSVHEYGFEKMPDAGQAAALRIDQVRIPAEETARI